MKKELRLPFVWQVVLHDFNADSVKPYSVLDSYKEPYIKKLKKKFNKKEDFAEELRKELSWQYRARCEYEMIMYLENNRVYLEPWVGTFTEGRVDITENKLLDWPAFAKEMLYRRGWRDKKNNRIYVKFDVYDQIMFRFDEFINFVWHYQHKYQRVKKGI